MHRFRFALTGLLILSLALGTYCFLNYYQVTSVEVRGAVHYDEEEIRSLVLKGFASQNTVLATRLLSQEDIEDHPFLDSIRVTAPDRNTLSLNVVEKKPIGCISYLGNFVYFDKDGIFVEGQTQREKGIPLFSQVKVSQVIKNERIEMQDRSLILQAASVLYSFYEKTGLETDAVWIDDNYQLYAQVGDIQIRLGSLTLLEEKLSRSMAVLKKLEGRYGLLHAETITQNNKSLSFEEQERPASQQEPSLEGASKEEGALDGEPSEEKDSDQEEKDKNASSPSQEEEGSGKEDDSQEENDSGETHTSEDSYDSSQSSDPSETEPSNEDGQEHEYGSWDDSYQEETDWNDSYQEETDWNDSYQEETGWNDSYQEETDWNDSYQEETGWDDSNQGDSQEW